MTAAEPHSSRMWCVVLLLATVGSGLCVSEFEFVGNLAENYDNHIFQDQQEGECFLICLFGQMHCCEENNLMCH